MKKRILSGVLAILALSTGSTALAGADTWSPEFHIDTLYTYGTGYRISDVSTSSGYNPAACGGTLSAHVWPLATLSDVAKEEMGKVLLSAYLADRPVRVRISGTVCESTNVRTYVAVELR
jgi:hypothetical protein